MRISKFDDRRGVWSWALYDWANSAFATTIVAGFFPVFFKRYWSEGSDVAESTLRLGLANSAASAVIIVLAPLLGAVADAAAARKRFLIACGALGILATAGLFLVARGDWLSAWLLFVIGSIGWMGGNVFYDALLVTVARDRERDRASAFGYALGYLGGGLLFAVNVAAVLNPSLFGLRDAAQATRLSFLSVAIWWALFSIPLLRFVREPALPASTHAPLEAVAVAFRQLRHTLEHIRQLRVTFGFLLAYWLYIDGVDTIIRMAVDYGLSIGLEEKHLIGALLLTQFVGFPAAIVFGSLGERLGAKRGILIGIGVYIGVTLWAAQMETASEFYALAATVGLVQGGVQALSRSLYARLIPVASATEFFGFYNMLGKFAAILGPTLVGFVGVATGSPRASILAVLVLFVGGALLLMRVDVEAGQSAAEAFGEKH